MMISNGLLKADLLRLIKGKELYIGIIIIFSLMWLGVWDDFKLGFSEPSYYYGLSHLTVFYQITLPVSAALGAIYFCDDWNTKVFWLFESRCGIKKYCYTRCLFAMFSGGAVAVIGEIMFLLSMLPRHVGFDLSDAGIQLAPYTLTDISLSGKLLLYYILTLLTVFLRNALTSIFALYFSTLIPNRFVVICSPLILWMVLSFIAEALKLPTTLNIDRVYMGRCNIESSFMWILYVIIITIVLCTVLSELCYKGMQRRIEK